MGFLMASCAGTGASRHSERDLSHADLLEVDEAADTDCSYFYFLWGRISEIDGRLDEALEAYEKAVVCDGEADYAVRHLAALLLRMNRKKQAISWVDKLVLSNPADPKIKIFQADLYSSMGEVDKAAALYEKVLHDDKKNTTALTKLGKLYLNNLDYTNARTVFEKLVKYEPDSFPGYYYLARLYQELKFYDKAIASYQKALDLNWTMPLALEVAEFYETQGLFEDAIVLYKKVLTEDDTNDAAGGRLVRLYLAMDQSDKALEVLNNLRETTLDAQKVDFTIGRIFMEQKRYDEAIALFMDMLEREPDADVARSLLALAYYEKGRKDKAKHILLQISPQDKGYNEAIFMLVKIYSEEKNYDAAIDLVTKVLQSAEPVPTNYYFVLASLYEEAGKLIDAEKVFVEALNQFPESTEVYFKYGMFLERSGRLDEALVQMEEVLALNPQDAYALNYIGYTWAERNENLERALDYIKQAISLRPEDGFIRDSLGWIYFRLGELKKAVAELEKAAAIEPEDPTVQEHLGDVYLAQGKKQQAVAHYRQSLMLSDKEEAKKRLQEKIDLVK
jgi:tetratricopeptide (TPR) repeat protein